MFNKILSLYSELIVYPVEKYDLEHYYFYKSGKKTDVFGISKKITNNEYELIKTNFVEKKVYSLDNKIQKIYDYLLEDGNNPFKKNVRILIYSVNTQYQLAIEEFLKDLISDIKIINILHYQVAIYSVNKDMEFNQFFTTLSDDIGMPINLHKGLIITPETLGKDVIKYIYAYDKTAKLKHNTYSEMPELIFNLHPEDYIEIITILKKYLFKDILEDDQLITLINKFFENDLNVSQTAKQLYLHRNSLLNRLENIYLQTGFNIQKFNHATALKVILTMDI